MVVCCGVEWSRVEWCELLEGLLEEMLEEVLEEVLEELSTVEVDSGGSGGVCVC